MAQTHRTLVGAAGDRFEGTNPRQLPRTGGRGAIAFGRVLSALLGAGLGIALATGGCAGSNTEEGDSELTAKVLKTPEEFRRLVLESSTPVVVDFFATWCPPCKELSPRLARVAPSYAGRIAFYAVDVDQSPELARPYQVSSIPILLMFRKGQPQPVDSLVGLQTEQVLREHFDKLAGGS